MPASIWPIAILLPMMIVLSSELPHARVTVMPGVVGARPEESVASRARFQSYGCLITAPNATSPSSTPCRPKRSTSEPSTLTDMPKLPMSAYAVLLRQNGMRTPPMMPTRLVVVTVCLVRSGPGRNGPRLTGPCTLKRARGDRPPARSLSRIFYAQRFCARQPECVTKRTLQSRVRGRLAACGQTSGAPPAQDESTFRQTLPPAAFAALGRYAWPLAVATVVACASAAHVYRIGDLPMGFYPDESSIGWNAWSIATSGRDEHGAAWPLYFRAFGEYKNPVYIYFLALVYKLLGFSEWTTRFASALCWLAGSARARGARLARLRSAQRAPLRARLPRVHAVAVRAVAHFVRGDRGLSAARAASLCDPANVGEAVHRRGPPSAGCAIGLAAYAYSTLRLLAPLYVVAALLCNLDRRRRREWLAFAGAAALTALPLAIYLLSHAANLAARFDILTYLHDPALTLADKLQYFLGRYFEYFAPPFLALDGDPNLRHHTGFGGELLFATALLLFVGIAGAIASRDERRDPFVRLLIVDLALSPLAAALTLDHDHSLRAFPLVVFAILLSAYGLRWITRRFGALASGALAAAAALQAAFYLHDYFVAYPAVSARAFENYGFKDALVRAASIAQNRIVVDSADNQPYISALFFGALMPEKARVPIVVGDLKSLDARRRARIRRSAIRRIANCARACPRRASMRSRRSTRPRASSARPTDRPHRRRSSTHRARGATRPAPRGAAHRDGSRSARACRRTSRPSGNVSTCSSRRPLAKSNPQLMSTTRTPADAASCSNPYGKRARRPSSSTGIVLRASPAGTSSMPSTLSPRVHASRSCALLSPV